MRFKWRYPVFENDGTYPDKYDWPTNYAYHILQMNKIADPRLYAYNEDDFIVALYNPMLECWRTESGIDFIEWKDVKRWAVLLDEDGKSIKDMESDDA